MIKLTTTSGRIPLAIKTERARVKLVRQHIAKPFADLNYKKHIQLATTLLIVAGVLVVGTIYAKGFYDQQRLELQKTQQQIVEIQNKSVADAKVLQDQIANVKAASARDAAAAAASAALAVKKSANSNDNFAVIVTEWQNRIVKVGCVYNDKSVGEGSATIVNMTSYGLSAVTNSHVINDLYGNIAFGCVVINNLGGRTIINDGVKLQDAMRGTAQLDWALIEMGNSDTATDNGSFSSVANSHVNVCKPIDVGLGDKILILGYPYDGSTSGVTITQGIVSGYDGDYYVTDAKIDHGNSGGAAILLKNDCWLGIPSNAYAGKVESYGRILKGNLVLGY